MLEYVEIIRSAGYEFCAVELRGSPLKYYCRIVDLKTWTTNGGTGWPTYYEGVHPTDPIAAMMNALPKKDIEDFSNLA